MFTSNSLISHSMFFFSPDYIPVLLDGIVLGGILPKDAPEIVAQLRYLKAASNNCGLHAQGSSTSSTDINTVTVLSKNKLLLDPTMEVAYIPRLPYDCAYPGVYLFTQAGRMIRPVLQLGTHYVEWIGPMEVRFFNINSQCSNFILPSRIWNGHISFYFPFLIFLQSYLSCSFPTASVYGDCLPEDRHPSRRDHAH